MAGKPKALVTGGTRGIGRATVLELGRAGFDVAFTGRTRTEGKGQEIAPDGTVSVLPGSLDNTQKALGELGATGLPIQMDLLDPASVDRTVATVMEAWGGVDLLVNNAFYESGRYTSSWIKDIPVEEFQGKMQANFFAPLALISSFAKFDDAVEEANRLPYGLASYAFTSSTKTATAIGAAVESGMISINSFGLALPEVPFGGVKDSGYGSEGGTEAMDGYFNTKFITQTGV